MKKVFLMCGLAIMIAACSDESVHSAAQSDHKPPLPPVSMLSKDDIEESEEPLPAWVAAESKTIAPMETVVIEGKRYTATNYCRPHFCAGDFMISLTADERGGGTFSLVVSVADVNGAIFEPSKYAKYWWIGNPDSAEKTELINLLYSNPNWK